MKLIWHSGHSWCVCVCVGVRILFDLERWVWSFVRVFQVCVCESVISLIEALFNLTQERTLTKPSYACACVREIFVAACYVCFILTSALTKWWEAVTHSKSLSWLLSSNHPRDALELWESKSELPYHTNEGISWRNNTSQAMCVKTMFCLSNMKLLIATKEHNTFVDVSSWFELLFFTFKISNWCFVPYLSCYTVVYNSAITCYNSAMTLSLRVIFQFYYALLLQYPACFTQICHTTLGNPCCAQPVLTANHWSTV